MIALLLALVLSRLPAVVTLTSRGETVEALLREASKSSGVSMATVPETGQDIVIASVKDVPVKEFQDRLAQAVGARWRPNGGVLYLVRPIDMIESQQAAERRLRILEIKKGLEEIQKRVSTQGEFTAEKAKVLAKKVDALNTKYKGHLSDSPGLEAEMAIQPDSPGGRLSISAVASLTAEQIADVGPGERIVYSTEPTAVQRPFSVDLSPAVQRFQAEQTIYADAIKDYPFAKKFEGSRSPLMIQSSSQDVAGLILSTERSPYNPSLTVQVSLFRKDGSYAAEVGTLLDLGESKRSDPPLGEGKIPLSQTSRKFVAALAELQKGKTFVHDKDLLSQLTQPEKFDPLSYVAADGVFGLAKQRNLIACLPDDGFIMPAFSAVSDSKNVDQVAFSNWLTNACEVDVSDSWFVVRPRRMILTRSLRVDRSILGRFLRISIENEGVRLDETADFVSQMPRNYMDSIVPMLAFFVMPDLNAGVSDRNVEMLRVYGRLPVEQRKALQAGQSIALSNLGEGARAEMNHLLFRADPPVSVMFKQGEDTRSSVRHEVTCAFPNGAPDASSFSMHDQEADAVLVDQGSARTANYRPMNAWSLAYELVRAERADPTDKREKTQIERYRFGHSKNVWFEFHFSPRVSAEAEFNETSFSRSGPALTYSELPAAFRKEVEDAMLQVRAQRAETTQVKRNPPP